MENRQDDALSEQEDDLFHAYSVKAEGTNINPQTLLATDYLNHFNEIIMLLDMIPDMPDCFEDAQAWLPKSYQAHFEDSQFRDKKLAIEAYDHVPARYRKPFEEVVAQMNGLIATAIIEVGEKIDDGGPDLLKFICSEASRNVQTLMDVASAIIHGSETRYDQKEIDGLLGR